MLSTTIEGRVAQLLERIGAAERALSFTAFLVLIFVVFADVVSREFSGTGLHWARQAGVYANIFVVMFGIGLASAHGAHLRPRFADGWLPARWAPGLVRVQEGLMAIFCLGFALLAASVVIDSHALGERSVVLRIVIWPIQAIIPLVFLIAAFRHGAYGVFSALRPTEDVLEA
jgi:TRAP-type C4-dicarboxylate transport system permease small subunit